MLALFTICGKMFTVVCFMSVLLVLRAFELLSTNFFPDVACPSTYAIHTDAGTCSAFLNYSLPTYSDNCMATSSTLSSYLPGSIFPLGSTAVTYTATDGALHSTSCTFSVVVTDNERPVVGMRLYSRLML